MLRAHGVWAIPDRDTKTTDLAQNKLTDQPHPLKNNKNNIGHLSLVATMPFLGDSCREKAQD